MRNKNGFGNLVLILLVVTIVASSTLSVLAYFQPSLVTEPTDSHASLDTDVLSHVQEHGLKGVPVIVADSDRGDLSITGDSWEGQYSEGRDRIYLNEDKLNDPDFNLMHTLWHEYGHHVWAQELTDREKNEYREIYESGSASTEYGLEEGVEEDFAESYALYMLDHNLSHNKEWFMFTVETEA